MEVAAEGIRIEETKLNNLRYEEDDEDEEDMRKLNERVGVASPNLGLHLNAKKIKIMLEQFIRTVLHRKGEL